MLTITDINGATEALTDYKDLAIRRRVNGERSLSFLIIATERNAHSYELVAEESIVEYGGEQYRIKQVEARSVGERSVKRIVAHHVFFDLIDSHKYETFTGQRTLTNILNWTLSDTGYTFAVIDSFSSQEFENFGDDNVLALIQTILNRYGAELHIDGTHLTFRAKIGVKTDMQLRYKHNLKTLAKHVDTSKLSTYIRGYGAPGITAEYTSPHVDKWGLRHAAPVRDDRYTTTAGLLARLQRELTDEPEISFTAEYAELKRAGFTYEQFSLGDEIYVIVEPMGIDITARIVEYEEYPEQPDATKITLANFLSNASDILAEFGRVSKTVESIVTESGKVRTNVLDEAVQRATKAIVDSMTELEYPENGGIIARSKTDPNRLLALTSEGWGISTDGGQTFKEAITADGFVLTAGVIGYMLFNNIRGGTLTLGGHDNVNGIMQVLNSNGDVIADLDGDRGGFSDITVGDLHASNIYAPNIIIPARDSRIYYVRGSSGSDENAGDNFPNGLYSIQEAINRVPKVYDGTCEIYLHSGYDLEEAIRIEGFTGSGLIILDLRGHSIKRRVIVTSCNLRVMIINGTIQNNDSSNADIISNDSSQYVHLENLTINGNGHYRAVRTWRGGATWMLNCQVHNVERVVESNTLGRTHVQNVKGNGTIYGLAATSSGFITGAGEGPTGSTADLHQQSGGRIDGNWNYPSEPEPTPPPPPPSQEQTREWSTSDSASYHDGVNAWDNTTGRDVLQGRWNSSGPYRGVWFFGSGPSNAVTGKTIKRIRVYLTRANNSGQSSSVNAIIRPHGYTSKPSGRPDYLSGSHSVGFSWGQGKWVTLPSSFHSLFQSGSAKGIMIYTTSTSNSNYMRFSGTARIEITYE